MTAKVWDMQHIPASMNSNPFMKITVSSRKRSSRLMMTDKNTRRIAATMPTIAL